MRCGLGNWADISDQYVKSKLSKECEDHYYTFYNKSKENIIPKDSDYIVSQKTIMHGAIETVVDEAKNQENLKRLTDYQAKRQHEYMIEQ